MRYDISKPTAPKMPNLGRGTECIKLLLSQVSKNMQKPLIPMLFPVLGTSQSDAAYLHYGVIIFVFDDQMYENIL